MTPPALVYLAIGLVVARIELDGIRTRRFTWLEWLQYLVNAARITLLWPLVLLVEKLETWLRSEPKLGLSEDPGLGKVDLENVAFSESIKEVRDDQPA